MNARASHQTATFPQPLKSTTDASTIRSSTSYSGLLNEVAWDADGINPWSAVSSRERVIAPTGGYMPSRPPSAILIA